MTMIIRLFSIFDPFLFILSFNWLFILLIFFFLLVPTWKNFNPTYFIKNFSFISLLVEIKILLGNQTFYLNKFLMIMFLIIFTNFLSLHFYIFCISSHLIFTILIGLSIWLTFFLYSLIVSPKNFLAHLVPNNTPLVLIFFIVLVENISTFIRPLTLSIRLIANIISGHLIICLISSQLPYLSTIRLIILLSFILISFIELAVRIIQRYVYIALLTLYVKDLA